MKQRTCQAKDPATCRVHGYQVHTLKTTQQSSPVSTIEDLYIYLTFHGVHLKKHASGYNFNSSNDYQTMQTEVEAELSKVFTTGGSGQEKIMFTNPELPFVVKIPGNSEWQNPNNGLVSLFQEYTASRDGIDNNAVMAKTELFWHSNGFPITIQEKLSNLTNHITPDLAQQLPWLPESVHRYAQIGQTQDGSWCYYDIDADSFSTLHKNEKQGDKKLETIFKEFFTTN